MNPYEQAREERIKRNNAMLAQLEVSSPFACSAEQFCIPEVSWPSQMRFVRIQNPLELFVDCNVQLKQQVQAIAAPLAAAAEVDAKREAHMRAQLAAVQPRQRSMRSSAAQAKKALTRQAAVSYTSTQGIDSIASM